MNLVPVTSPYGPMFNARCIKCGQMTRSDSCAADLDGEPFKAYLCFGCQPQDVRDAVAKAANEAFRALSESQKHDVRVKTLGGAETREIEARARYT